MLFLVINPFGKTHTRCNTASFPILIPSLRSRGRRSAARHGPLPPHPRSPDSEPHPPNVLLIARIRTVHTVITIIFMSAEYNLLLQLWP